MVGLRPAAVALLVGLALPPAAGAHPPLETFVVEGSVALAADTEGGVACWQRDRARVLTWHRDGSPRSICELDDPRLPLTPNLVAYRDGRALLSFLDFAAGSENQRKAVLLDTDACRILALPALPGVVHSLSAAGDGWLAMTREPFAPASSLLRLDKDGEIADAFSLDRTFDRLLHELDLEESPIARGATPFAVGRDLWLLPTAAYELWFPPQRGRPLRRVAPPDCLAATARQLRGAERTALLEARAARFPEHLRGPLEAMIRSSSPTPTLVSATAGVTVLGDLVAVKILDPSFPEGARLDLWEVAGERVVATLPFPVARRVLGPAEDGMWVLENGTGIRRVPLPQVPEQEPGADLCRQDVAAGAVTTAALSTVGGAGR